MTKISIAEDFSRVPAGRFLTDGPFSGERFRDELLREKLADAKSRGEHLVVNLDGVEGYGSSFLEEAFGGLIRHGFSTVEELDGVLILEHKEPGGELYEKAIRRYIERATTGC